MAPLIACTGVSYRFPGGPIALNQVTTALHAGTCLALVGANGAGKSTLLQVLSGLLMPSSGSLCIDGRAVGQDWTSRRRWRTTVALVLQDPNDQLVAPTVWEDVGFGPANLGLDRLAIAERVDQALDWLGISDLADRPPHLLSYGQRRRVVLAGALAMRPRALLLDEPTAGLDPTGEGELLELLRRLVHEQGCAVALATHCMDALPAIADHIAVLASGTVLRSGTPAEIFDDADLLKRARLRLPGVAALMHELGSFGRLPDDTLPLTVEAAAAVLKGRLSP